MNMESQLSDSGAMNPLMNVLDICIRDFHHCYSVMSDGSTELSLERWEELSHSLRKLQSRHGELVRAAEEWKAGILKTLTPERNLEAINAGNAACIKKERTEAFEARCLTVPLPSENPTGGPYAVVELQVVDLIGLSNLLPGQHGWILICSPKQKELFFSLGRFGITLAVPGSSNVHYGVYEATLLPGQSMLGSEFSRLSETTRTTVAQAISNSPKGTTAFEKTLGDILYSKITVPCLFFQCIQKPILPCNDRPRKYSIPETMPALDALTRPSWDLVGSRNVSGTSTWSSEGLTPPRDPTKNSLGVRPEAITVKTVENPLKSILNRILGVGPPAYVPGKSMTSSPPAVTKSGTAFTLSSDTEHETPMKQQSKKEKRFASLAALSHGTPSSWRTARSF